MFGRGQAVLRTDAGHVIISTAIQATLDGIIVRREAGESDNPAPSFDEWMERGPGGAGGGPPNCGVWICGGWLRLQACDFVSLSGHCVQIDGQADPTVATCRCASGALSFSTATSFFSSAGSEPFGL